MPAVRRGIVLGSLLAALLSFTPPAWGQSDVARQHFEAGKKLRDEGDCTRAIPEFEASLAADKSIGGLYNLGYCHEQLGQRQRAYGAYKEAQELASAKKDDRLREISGALAALLETPHIRLVLPQPLPDKLAIRVDDQLVPADLYSAETVVFTRDARVHTVTVTAPGYEERREVVETKHVKPIELRAATTTAPSPTPPPEPGGWTWQHWSGIGVSAVGVGLLTVGSVMFISYAIEENSLFDQYDAAGACAKATPNRCTGADRDERTRLRRQYNDNEAKAQDNAPIMLGTAIGGALLIGGGILLVLTAPKSSTSSAAHVGVVPMVGATTQGAALTGTF